MGTPGESDKGRRTTRSGNRLATCHPLKALAKCWRIGVAQHTTCPLRAAGDVAAVVECAGHSMEKSLVPDPDLVLSEEACSWDHDRVQFEAASEVQARVNCVNQHHASGGRLNKDVFDASIAHMDERIDDCCCEQGGRATEFAKQLRVARGPRARKCSGERDQTVPTGLRVNEPTACYEAPM
jgi:hypothetical protein